MVAAMLLLAGCKPAPPKGMICEWYLSDEKGEKWLTNQQLMVLRLYPKGLYTYFGSGNYSFGQWRINEKGSYLHLTQEKGNMEKDLYLHMNKKEPGLIQTDIYGAMPFYANQRMAAFFLKGKDNRSQTDPYSSSANLWRIKPAAPESDAAIKKRVMDYLRFLEAMYQHGIDNEMDALNMYWYPMPLQMYFGNGVRMAYSNELDDWNECFYDSAQAVKGYQVISGAFYDVKLKSGVNKFERNLDFIKQLLKQLEK